MFNDPPSSLFENTSQIATSILKMHLVTRSKIYTQVFYFQLFW